MHDGKKMESQINGGNILLHYFRKKENAVQAK